MGHGHDLHRSSSVQERKLIMTRSLLIVEDNEQNLYMMQFLLEKHGFTVAAAQNGPAGIELALRLKPAAILLDIQLPLMDGYAVAAELKKQDALAGIPIIAVTSYAMVGDREKIIAAGATGYIEKPINPDTFVDEIRGYLSKSPRRLKGATGNDLNGGEDVERTDCRRP